MTRMILRGVWQANPPTVMALRVRSSSRACARSSAGTLCQCKWAQRYRTEGCWRHMNLVFPTQVIDQPLRSYSPASVGTV
jgi:hypothetical protein